MSLFRTITSAIGKLAVVAALLAAFLAGLGAVVWLSLRGEELKVPEIVGKDVLESEKELAALGLKLKKRSSLFSEEKPNTVLEQLPKAGETVKTGQIILVTVSKKDPEGSEEPATVDKEEAEQTEAGNEAAAQPKTSKPKNKANANADKKASTTRDVVSNKSGNKNSNIAGLNKSNGNKAGSNQSNGNSSNKAPANSNQGTKSNSSGDPKPGSSKTPVPSGGDTRSRKVP